MGVFFKRSTWPKQQSKFTYCNAKSKKSAMSSMIHSGKEAKTAGASSAGSGRPKSVWNETQKCNK